MWNFNLPHANMTMYTCDMWHRKGGYGGKKGKLSLYNTSARKCMQHRSPSTEETEIEKGKSEFVHLGKISHWRQSISKSVLLKRARWKYSSSQHKRRWHTFQSIGYRHCAGKFHIKEICKNQKVMKDGDAQQHTQISVRLKKSNDPLLSNQSY